MPVTSPIAKAVVVTPNRGDEARLRKLRDLLTGQGVTVAMVDKPEDAAAAVLMDDPSTATIVIIDACGEDDAGTATEDIAGVLQRIEVLSDTLPQLATVVAAAAPPSVLLIACFRAGAKDFIDLSTESAGGMSSMLARLGASLSVKVEQRERVRDLRAIVEDFLRDLIKTERRSIDLEHKLKLKDKSSAELTGDLDSDRDPVVVIIEDDVEVADLLVDELEEVGVATFAFVNGEDAVNHIRKMANKAEAVDIALVDAVLPGIDGLTAIRQMREHRPGLAAILMTGHSSTDIATHAADLGVVGYVLKPFDDIDGLIARIKEQATHYMAQSRERHYLARIKKRHEKVLMRYRKLASDLDRII